MRRIAVALAVVGALAGCGGGGSYSFTKGGVTTHCRPNGVGTGVVCASVDNKVATPSKPWNQAVGAPEVELAANSQVKSSATVASR